MCDSLCVCVRVRVYVCVVHVHVYASVTCVEAREEEWFVFSLPYFLETGPLMNQGYTITLGRSASPQVLVPLLSPPSQC